MGYESQYIEQMTTRNREEDKLLLFQEINKYTHLDPVDTFTLHDKFPNLHWRYIDHLLTDLICGKLIYKPQESCLAPISELQKQYKEKNQLWKWYKFLNSEDWFVYTWRY